MTFKMNIQPDSSVVMSPTPLDGTLPIALARFSFQAVAGSSSGSYSTLHMTTNGSLYTTDGTKILDKKKKKK